MSCYMGLISRSLFRGFYCRYVWRLFGLDLVHDNSSELGRQVPLHSIVGNLVNFEHPWCCENKSQCLSEHTPNCQGVHISMQFNIPLFLSRGRSLQCWLWSHISFGILILFRLYFIVCCPKGLHIKFLLFNFVITGVHISKWASFMSQ